MTGFEIALKERIKARGDMTLGEYMAQCLIHYYSTRDPFGAAGDFTTAPEISQIFGELIGAWTVDAWQKLGSPAKFHLIECGPGRGTLMADALRATQKVQGFHAALQLHLLEMSPILQDIQREKLGHYHPIFHARLETIPTDAPWIVIGNEFLDALPIEQIQFKDDVWLQRMVGLEQNAFVYRDAPSSLSGPNRAQGIVEISPARDLFWSEVCRALKNTKGVCLMLDYGYVEGTGDTFQALKNHQYVDPLKHAGEADLTAHVNFGALKHLAQTQGLDVHGPATQGAFLENLGLSARRDALIQSNSDKADEIQSGASRLVASEQMGRLFKVLAVSVGLKSNVAGFNEGNK